MALIRPVVLVFQEFATPTVTPTTPDLNCLVVGPAYHIQDYYKPGTTDYADKDSIQLAAAYGQLEANIGTLPPSGPAVITVADPPNNKPGAVLDAASVKVYFDNARVVISSGVAGTTSSGTPNTFVQADAGVDFTTGANKVLPGDRIVVKDGTTNNIVRTVFAVVNATTLTFTQDIPASPFVPGSGQSWRIERRLNDQVVDASFYSVQGNTLTIDGGITLNVPTQGAKTVSYAVGYMQYRSLRQDLVELDTLTSTDEIDAKIGRIDARNPLAVGVFVARQNTTTMVQFIGVETNDLVGHTKVRDAIASRPDVYAIVPLTADTSVIAMWNADNVGLAIPDESNGRPQRFRVVIGSSTLPLTKTLIEPQATGQILQKTGSAPSGNYKLNVPGATFIADGVLPGDILTIALDVGGTPVNGTYTVAQVISNTALEIDGVFPSAKTLDVAATFGITGPGGSPVRRAVATATSAATTSAGVDLYLILKDASGSFVSSGVAAGDVIEIPATADSTDFTGTNSKFVVATVLSENRLEIVNGGRNTSTVENELPHGVKRTATTALVPTTATINYRIKRNLTKSQQVTELVAVAQSFNSRRTILVWPDKCDVAGVTGGTAQPGYYLGCAVGGMTAGLPSHQGFTFLGIAGISKIYNSNTYFNDVQLTDLSQGGWYVFAQQTPTALPHTIHQLTTDVSTLESGEFSVVKNFDFVSLFFVDILEDFLGQYNINQETLVLLRGALNIGGETLKLRTYAKIGAPLTSFAINDLGVSPVSADRVVTHLATGLPKPLNVVELHLVA